jgi:hypothetical protein
VWLAVPAVATAGCELLAPLDGLTGGSSPDASPSSDANGASLDGAFTDTNGALAADGGSAADAKKAGDDAGHDSPTAQDGAHDAATDVPGVGPTYKRQITVTAGDALTARYAVHFALDASALVGAGKIRTDLNDLRIVDASGAQLDRIVDPAGASGQQPVWFAVEHALAAGASDTYWLEYGDPSAGPAAQNGSNVFAFYDDFSSAAIGPLWTVLGSPALSSDGVTLHAWNTAASASPDALSASVTSVASSLETIVLVSQPSTPSAPSGEFYWWGFQVGFGEVPPWQVWISRGSGGQAYPEQNVPGSASCSNSSCAGQITTLDASQHWYRIERAPSGTRYYRDGVQAANMTDPNTAASAVMLRNFTPQSSVVVSLVRDRPLVDREPSVTLGPEL